MKKLALCAGHYLGTEDRRCLKKYDPNETQEWTLNDRVADRVQKLLASYDVEVRRMDDTTGEMYISVNNRVATGNAWGADFWLGIHHNAGINGGKGGGISAYVYTTKPAESVDWQKRLYENLMKYHSDLKGNRATPLSTGNLAEVRDTKMPAVLLELGFMDSSTDIPIIITDAHVEKSAMAIVDTIVSKWGLKSNDDKDVIWSGGAIYTAKEKTSVYQTSELANKIGTLFKGESANIVCSVGKAYGVCYDITDSNGKPTGEKKLGFVPW